MSTSHSNEVQIKCSLITAMSYTGFFNITSGQPSTLPPTSTKNGDTWTIKLEAGRQKSSDVAAAFNKASIGDDTTASPAQHEFAGSGGGGTPDELNFCFGMLVTFVSNDVQVQSTLYFAQGNYSTTNNWWIGGDGILNFGSPLLVLIHNNSIIKTLKVSGSVSSFTLA